MNVLHAADENTSFAEMPTSSFVESGFWCFDALFVPQQHPAREVQDTFYLSGEYFKELNLYDLTVENRPRSCNLPRPSEKVLRDSVQSS